LIFRKFGHLNISENTDADCIGNANNRRSTAGYFIFVGDLITWRSKRQNVVPLSSAEAEFRGMTKGICELLWLRKLLFELIYPPTILMKLFYDNKAAIDMAHKSVQHDRTKYVKIDRYFIKEKIESGTITIPYVHSSEQLAIYLLFTPENSGI
jgi:hypothetical protein